MHAGIPSFLMSQDWHDVIIYTLHSWELQRQVRKIFPGSSNVTAYLFSATRSPRVRSVDMPTSPRTSALHHKNHFLDSLASTERSWHQRLCAWEISQCQHEQGPHERRVKALIVIYQPCSQQICRNCLTVSQRDPVSSTEVRQDTHHQHTLPAFW